MEVFLKRAERPYKEKLGEVKTKEIFEKIRKALYLIPSEFSGTLGPEIPRFLFTYSQKLEEISPENIEGILLHVLIFTNSLTSLLDTNLSQVNQKILNRSKSEMRNMMDLLNNFVEKAKNGELMKKFGTIDAILDYMIGKETFTQFNDLERFLKKAKDNFSGKIGEEQADFFSKEISQAFKNIDEELKDYIDSEISKYLFTLSQDIDNLPFKALVDILQHVVFFIKALSDIGSKNKEQLNQEIIRRSKNQLRGLFDLFKRLLYMAKEGKVLESFQNLEDVMTHILGEEKEHLKFTDVGGFLKRVEKKYMMYLGDYKGQMLISDILNSLADIPEVHRAYLGSDISRFLTKFSETMNKLTEKEIEQTLTRTLMFTNAISELGDLNREETNQFILKRSKHKVRNLFELYKAFLDMEKVFFLKSSMPSLDEILNYTLGKFSGPKAFKISDKPIYELLVEYNEELPIVDEYAQWAKSIRDIVPRYLEILKNEEGERIRKQLWETKLPLDQISENYLDIIVPREEEEEIPFTNRLMHMLTYDILVDKNKNRALAGALAYSIFSKMLTDVFGGQNATIHAIKVVQLLDERKFATGEKKKEIDEFLIKIVEEELNSIKRRMMNVKAIVPVLTLNEYYIKTYDITKKIYPEIVVKIFSDINPLKNIGKEKMKLMKNLNMLGTFNSFTYSFDIIAKFHKSYFLEIEEIPLDARKKFGIFQDFFDCVLNLEENIDLGKFYDSRIYNADRLTLIYALKFLYEPLMPVFKILEPFFEQNTDVFKVKSMVYYLSGLKQKESKRELKQLQEDIRNSVAEQYTDDSIKMKRLKIMLEKQTSSIKFFRIMDDLLNEAQKAKKIIEPRIDFCREIFIFLDMVKAIHPTLPVTFTQYLGKLNEFANEIDEVMQKVKDTRAKKLISPSEFHEINANANTTKNRLIELTTKDLIKNHIKEFVKVSKKPILTQDIFKIIEEPEIEPVEINPLEIFFKKYNDELSAVDTTDTLDKFTEAFKFWLKEDVFPLTLSKAEELLLKNIFKKIKKKVQKIIDESEEEQQISTQSEETITEPEENELKEATSEKIEMLEDKKEEIKEINISPDVSEIQEGTSDENEEIIDESKAKHSVNDEIKELEIKTDDTNIQTTLIDKLEDPEILSDESEELKTDLEEGKELTLDQDKINPEE